MSLISVNNLARYYGNFCAVDNISFTLEAGDILGFLGPNGAGKSTTMQILTGNLAPSGGEIRINDIDLLDQPVKAKSEIGYLPETPPLYKELTIDEYLTYCAKLHNIKPGDCNRTVSLAKKRCGLSDSGHRLIANLSKGYQQRVGIAQAILHSPKVIILDEPTVGLDPNQIREIRGLISELGKEHGIILCTHILPEVQAVCNRVQIINQGRLVYESDMNTLLDKQTTHAYEIAFKQPPETGQLSNINHVTGVEQTGSQTFLIDIDNNLTDDLVKAAVENDWGLYQLTPHKRTLEHIFVELTLSENNKESPL